MVMIPSVHLNGTSKQELIQSNLAAKNAITEAIIHVQRSAPNGRDFYPQSTNAIITAVAEHWERINKLKKVRDDFEKILEKLTE